LFGDGEKVGGAEIAKGKGRAVRGSRKPTAFEERLVTGRNDRGGGGRSFAPRRKKYPGERRGTP